jgi:hypothetical protein
MSLCFLFKVFEQYQKSRTQFVQTVAELASRPQNIETLQNAGVMSLLRPLLLDIVPTIQQTAALALGRLANYNDDLAEAVVKGDILPQLVYSLAEQNVSCYAVCLLMNTVKLCILCTPLFPGIVIFVCRIISAVVIAKCHVSTKTFGSQNSIFVSI